MGTIFPQPGEPPPPTPGGRANDSIGRGVGFAIVCQVCCILAGFGCMLAGLNHLNSVVRPFLYFMLPAWGLIQFIVLVPLLLAQFKRGHSLTAKGILITASIGFLLNAACDALFRISPLPG